MTFRLLLPIAFLIVVDIFATSASAADVPLLRDRSASDRPALLVLGVAHFDNPGHDAVNVKVDDMLAPKRQQEIEALVDALAAYKPTHVVVEYPIAKQAKLDQRYRDYRAGKYTLTRNETDQLGLRLAAKLGLDRVDAADWNEEPPGIEADYDFAAWASQHEEAPRLGRVFDHSRATKEEALLAHSSISEYLCALNAPETLTRDAQVYFDVALFGDAKANPGAVWVGDWYARNLRILANLVRIAAKPSDRVVAIYGAGHKPLLDRYGAESLAFKVDDVRSVLHCR